MKSFLRLMRDTPKLAASIIAIAAITAMFLSQMVVQGNAQEKIAETWRGAYDILVLPASASNQELTDEEGRTLLDPNFANVSGDPIPSKLLQSIDKLENVDVAAPIGFIARYSGASEVPTLTQIFHEVSDGRRNPLPIDSRRPSPVLSTPKSAEPPALGARLHPPGLK